MEALDGPRLVRAVLDPAVRIDTERFGRTTVPRGWRLDRRRVDEHYFAFYLDRSAGFAAGGVAGTCRPGSAFLVAPGEAHDVVPTTGTFTFYHWRFRLWRGRRELRWGTPAWRGDDHDALRPLLDAAWDEQLADRPLAAERQRALLAATLAACLRPVEPRSGLAPDQRRRVLDLVARRLPRPVHPRELARACGLSHDWFARRFRATFGTAPRTWLLHERLRHAAEDLLGSRDPVGAVALRWGFDSLAVFSRQFKQRYGHSPSSWRRRLGA